MKASENAKRDNLYLLRCERRLSQAEIAAKIGVSRQVYAYIENGKRSGTAEFWAAIQREFDVADEAMYKLMKLENREREVCEEIHGQ